jgi:hypothetical protein
MPEAWIGYLCYFSDKSVFSVEERYMYKVYLQYHIEHNNQYILYSEVS